MENILVVGANGMLGHDLVRVFTESGYNVVGATRKDFDITKIKEMEDFFEDKSFDLVINSAAYTQVDKAEEEEELAFLINEKGAENLANITNKKNIPIVYISTDYVFDGTYNKPYDTYDKPNPINIYGKSKLAGEIATNRENPKSYIIRTSWLYGENGKNFVNTMLELAKSRDEISVVNDQIGCPTWTLDLSKCIEKLIRDGNDFGIYQICGVDQMSWYEFAIKIFRIKGINIKVLPVKTPESLKIAKRPKFSVMSRGSVKGYVDSLSRYLGIVN